MPGVLQPTGPFHRDFFVTNSTLDFVPLSGQILLDPFRVMSGSPYLTNSLPFLGPTGLVSFTPPWTTLYSNLFRRTSLVSPPGTIPQSRQRILITPRWLPSHPRPVDPTIYLHGQTSPPRPSTALVVRLSCKSSEEGAYHRISKGTEKTDPLSLDVEFRRVTSSTLVSSVVVLKCGWKIGNWRVNMKYISLLGSIYLNFLIR